MFSRTALISLTLLLAVGCVGEKQDEASQSEGTMTQMSGPPPISGETVTTASGLQYVIIKEGSGEVAQPG